MSNQSPPQPKDKSIPVPPRDHPQHQEALLDEAVDETMDASDPISPYDKRSAAPVKPEAGTAEEPPSGARPWQGWTRSSDAKPR